MDDTTDWYGPESSTFGDRVAAARDQAGMTQAQLAKRLGIKLATVRHWEDDVSEPRANRLSMMAGILNVSMMWLINGTGEGVDAPAGGDIQRGDISEIMSELRDLRADMLKKAEHVGRLEKRLRRVLQDQSL